MRISSFLFTFLVAINIFSIHNIQVSNGCSFKKPSKCFNIFDKAADGVAGPVRDAYNDLRSLIRNNKISRVISMINNIDNILDDVEDDAVDAIRDLEDILDELKDIKNDIQNGLTAAYNEMEDAAEDAIDIAEDVVDFVIDIVKTLISAIPDSNSNAVQDMEDTLETCLDTLFGADTLIEELLGDIFDVRANFNIFNIDTTNLVIKVAARVVVASQAEPVVEFICGELSDYYSFVTDFTKNFDFDDYAENRRRTMGGRRRRTAASDDCDATTGVCSAIDVEYTSPDIVTDWMIDSALLSSRNSYSDGNEYGRYKIAVFSFDIFVKAVGNICSAWGDTLEGDAGKCKLAWLCQAIDWVLGNMVKFVLEAYVDFTDLHDDLIQADQMNNAMENTHVGISNQAELKLLLENMNTAIAGIVSDAETINTNVGNLESDVDNVSTTVDGLDTDLGNMVTQMDDLTANMADVVNRFNVVF